MHFTTEFLTGISLVPGSSPIFLQPTQMWYCRLGGNLPPYIGSNSNFYPGAPRSLSLTVDGALPLYRENLGNWVDMIDLMGLESLDCLFSSENELQICITPRKTRDSFRVRAF
ncbi:hypothetical protein AVEN_242436-1 [Araneus ventricosus]|uniref:Uncharacterized protein n=1 Tax=Araneus ventricosus TaxID=182803 RepID=A0A4Y2LEN8_ARAVE|nr:hypothetical protein AVEN_242436-1 [Araneus ventricosus]